MLSLHYLSVPTEPQNLIPTVFPEGMYPYIVWPPVEKVNFTGYRLSFSCGEETLINYTSSNQPFYVIQPEDVAFHSCPSPFNVTVSAHDTTCSNCIYKEIFLYLLALI